MEAAPGLAAAVAATLAAAQQIRHAFHAVTDDDLLTGLAEVEALGRLVDALRVAAAAEVETRSSTRFGEERLAFRHGARDAVELVQQLARIDVKEAKQRIGLGCALRPEISLLGDVLPGRYPELADAVRDGQVGLGAAREIVNTVKQLAPRVAPSDLEAMVEQLTVDAAVLDVPALHDAIDRCAGHLDPDGHRPTEALRHRKRALTIGRTLLDGTTSISMVVPPEQLALIREILQSRRRDIPLIRIVPGSDEDGDTSGPEWREACNPVSDEDPRTRKQQDLDTIIDVLTAGAATETADTTTATIHETIVTITAAELEARHGQGWTPASWPACRSRPWSGGSARAGSDCWSPATTAGNPSTSGTGNGASPPPNAAPSPSPREGAVSTPAVGSPPRTWKRTTCSGGAAMPGRRMWTTGSCSAPTTTISCTPSTAPSGSSDTTGHTTSSPPDGSGHPRRGTGPGPDHHARHHHDGRPHSPTHGDGRTREQDCVL